jgi:hypothetical protein
MASTESTITEVVVHRVRTKYHWPALQLNFWLLIMLIGASTILGIYASFITVQEQLNVGIPWYVLLDPFPIEKVKTLVGLTSYEQTGISPTG